jgi:hypothetical protein
MADEDEPKKKPRTRAKAAETKTPGPAAPGATDGPDEGDGTAGVWAVVPTDDGGGGGELATVASEPPTATQVDPRDVPQSLKNRIVLGTLYAHFAERDVQFILDGDAAMRLMAIFSNRGNRSMDDRLHPSTSDARNLWIALDHKVPLAMSWIPGVKEAPLTTIDPLPMEHDAA